MEGAAVYVLSTFDLSLVTIYSTKHGTASANPITTDSEGFFSFYADPGRYIISIQDPNYSPSRFTAVTYFWDAVSGATGGIKVAQLADGGLENRHVAAPLASSKIASETVGSLQMLLPSSGNIVSNAVTAAKINKFPCGVHVGSWTIGTNSYSLSEWSSVDLAGQTRKWNFGGSDSQTLTMADYGFAIKGKGTWFVFSFVQAYHGSSPLLSGGWYMLGTRITDGFTIRSTANMKAEYDLFYNATTNSCIIDINDTAEHYIVLQNRADVPTISGLPTLTNVTFGAVMMRRAA